MKISEANHDWYSDDACDHSHHDASHYALQVVEKNLQPHQVRARTPLRMVAFYVFEGYYSSVPRAFFDAHQKMVGNV